MVAGDINEGHFEIKQRGGVTPGIISQSHAFFLLNLPVLITLSVPESGLVHFDPLFIRPGPIFFSQRQQSIPTNQPAMSHLASASLSSLISSLPFIPLSYNHARSRDSALDLVLALIPEWAEHRDDIHLARFTDGITNTVCTFAFHHPVCKMYGVVHRNLLRDVTEETAAGEKSGPLSSFHHHIAASHHSPSSQVLTQRKHSSST